MTRWEGKVWLISLAIVVVGIVAWVYIVNTAQYNAIVLDPAVEGTYECRKSRAGNYAVCDLKSIRPA